MMGIYKNRYLSLLIVINITLIGIGCDDSPSSNDSDLEESLEPVENVIPVEGGENATIIVDKDFTAFFNVNFSSIGPNDIIQNGIKGGWCIDWKTPINSDGGTYTGIQLYSTFLVKEWMPVNYLLNIQEELQDEDPEITYREIQLAIWSLRGNPEFDLADVNLEELPNRFEKDGEANFNPQKVDEILNLVEEGYQDFNFSSKGTSFAVIAETPEDVQTIFGVVEN